MGHDNNTADAPADAHELLTAADRAVIEAAAEADWFRAAPVSEAFRAQFSPDFLSLSLSPLRRDSVWCSFLVRHRIHSRSSRLTGRARLLRTLSTCTTSAP